MRKFNAIICIAVFAVLVSGCCDKHQFTINGTLDNNLFDGETVYLYDNASPRTPVDSAVIANGKFTFTGTVTEPWAGVVANKALVQTLIVEPGTIVMTEDSISGTPLNDKLMEYIKGMDISDIKPELDLYEELYYSAPNATVRADAEHKYDSVEAIANARIMECSQTFYNDNRDNIIGALAMTHLSQMGNYTYAQFDSILADASDLVKNYAPVAQKLEQLRAIDATSSGKHYTDIQGVDGKLSDLIDGKLALVDFYASWCGPCRAEIKDNLVPLWKKYEKKGLVIVGLNVWERGDTEARKAAHEKVMADLGITYPQLVDSTRTATDTYGVQGIPQIILIGPDGTILARDLRGAAIEEAIVKALAK